MSDHTRKGICRTCRFWKPYPVDEGLPRLGICPMLGVFLFEQDVGETVAAIHANDRWSANPPPSDVLAVRTSYLFGCVTHEETEQ